MSKINNDFNRDLWCLLGLPFDSICMSDAINKVYFSAENKTSLFLSTPNLNFLIASQKDSLFKSSVINSDLSVADGKPLVWIARLLGVPIPERVAGSDLIENLIENKNNYKSIKVFFFGGEDGVANIACEKLNAHDTGLQCVGFLNPGFGSIDDMSSSEIINNINQSHADFVIVSLGAKKGQAWIEKNKNQLNAPIISHLGAVVNFIAGTVNRSPKLLQKLGLEWLWRIKEEPLLWKRYLNDGFIFLYLLIYRVVPLFFIIKFFEKKIKIQPSSIDIVNNADVIKLELCGYWGKDNITKINNMFVNIIDSNSLDKVEIIFNKGVYIDAAFMAKILLLKSYLLKNNRALTIKTTSKLVKRIFYYNCCENLLN